METPGMFNRLKMRAVEYKLKLEIIYELETLLLNRLSWNLPLETPAEVESLLRKTLFAHDEKYEAISSEISDWINLSMTEFGIYRKWDQFTLTISCIAISLQVHEFQDQLNFMAEFLKNCNCDLVDYKKVEECSSELFETMKREDPPQNELLNEISQEENEPNSPYYYNYEILSRYTSAEIEDETTKENTQNSSRKHSSVTMPIVETEPQMDDPQYQENPQNQLNAFTLHAQEFFKNTPTFSIQTNLINNNNNLILTHSNFNNNVRLPLCQVSPNLDNNLNLKNSFSSSFTKIEKKPKTLLNKKRRKFSTKLKSKSPSPRSKNPKNSGQTKISEFVKIKKALRLERTKFILN